MKKILSFLLATLAAFGFLGQLNVNAAEAVDKFTNVQTRSSLAINYDSESLVANNIKIRFGAKVAKADYNEAAEYGVIALPAAEHNKLAKIKAADLNTLNHIKAKPELNGESYQFAMVIKNMQGHYDFTFVAAAYKLENNVLTLAKPTINSVNALCREYSLNVAKYGVNADVKKVLDNNLVGFKNNYFEFENSISNQNSKGVNHFCINKSYAFSTGASGNIALKNLDVNAEFEFVINSSKEAEALLEINLNDYVAGNKKLNSVLRLTVNGVDMTNPYVAVPKGNGYVPTGLNATYFTMHSVLSYIKLNAGENRISIKTLNTQMNYDYINIFTDAALENKTVSNLPRLELANIKLPTMTAAGSATAKATDPKCKEAINIALPIVNAENYNIYAENGSNYYGLELTGKVNKIMDIKNMYEVTLANGTFANGTNKVSLPEGAVLTKDLFNAGPNGEAVVAIEAADNTMKPLNSFEITKNTTINSVVYGPAAGFKELDPGSEQNTRLPKVYNGLKLELFTNSQALGTVIQGGENGLAHRGSIVSYSGSMAVGGSFRLATKVSDSAVVIKGVEHQFQYNLENKGTTRIVLELNQVNSGTTIEKFPPVQVVLNPGESMSFIINATFKNGGNNKNCMSYFTVKEAMSDMKLGISMSVKLGK